MADTSSSADEVRARRRERRLAARPVQPSVPVPAPDVEVVAGKTGAAPTVVAPQPKVAKAPKERREPSPYARMVMRVLTDRLVVLLMLLIFGWVLWQASSILVVSWARKEVEEAEHTPPPRPVMQLPAR